MSRAPVIPSPTIDLSCPESAGIPAAGPRWVLGLPARGYRPTRRRPGRTAGIILCLLTPLLPVNQTTATIVRPQSPLPARRHRRRHHRAAGVRCPEAPARGVHSLARRSPPLPPSGGVAFSTNPAEGIDAARNGLFVRANADSVLSSFRDTVARWPRAAVALGDLQQHTNVWGQPGWCRGEFVGILARRETLPPDKATGDRRIHRPQAADPGPATWGPALSARITVDTRFITSPTPLKLAVMVVGVLCVIARSALLAVLDGKVPWPWRCGVAGCGTGRSISG